MSMLAADAPALVHGASQAAGQTPAPTPEVNGGRGTAGVTGIESARENKSTLADRIRALQSTASRAASSN
jgi:hypothetical protein